MTAIIVEFTVPGPPVAWERAGYNAKTGKYFTREKTRGYEKQVGLFCLQAMQRAGVRQQVPGEWALEITAWRPPTVGKQRRGDIDNCAKSVLDALNKLLYADDAQVTELHVFMCVDAKAPRLEVVARRK